MSDPGMCHERSALFFLPTADERGQPDCSFKGGRPGFVRVVDARRATS